MHATGLRPSVPYVLGSRCSFRSFMFSYKCHEPRRIESGASHYIPSGRIMLSHYDISNQTELPILSSGERSVRLQAADTYRASFISGIASRDLELRKDSDQALKESILKFQKEQSTRTLPTVLRMEILNLMANVQVRDDVLIYLRSNCKSRMESMSGLLQKITGASGLYTDVPLRHTERCCWNRSCVLNAEYISLLAQAGPERLDTCINASQILQEDFGCLMTLLSNGSTGTKASELSLSMIFEEVLTLSLCSDCWTFILLRYLSKVDSFNGVQISSSLHRILSLAIGTPTLIYHPSRGGFIERLGYQAHLIPLGTPSCLS